VFSYGYLPLAFSARCFTARAYNYPKDSCQFICAEHPQGMPLKSREGDRVFTINGIQTQSGSCYNLLPQLPAMRSMGVDIARISPQASGTAKVIDDFYQALQGGVDNKDIDNDNCNGYWFQRAGMENCYRSQDETNNTELSAAG